MSFFLGVSIGLIAALFIKIIPELHSDCVKETMVIFIFGYLSYLVADLLGQSGIISLFCCGFTLAHYAYFNISSEAQVGSKVAV